MRLLISSVALWCKWVPKPSFWGQVARNNKHTKKKTTATKAKKRACAWGFCENQYYKIKPWSEIPRSQPRATAVGSTCTGRYTTEFILLATALLASTEC